MIALRILAICVSGFAFAGCQRTESIVPGPIRIHERPQDIIFAQPIRGSSTAPEVIFEFQRSGDSQNASKIHLALLRTDGRRSEFDNPVFDRRGEALIAISNQPSNGANPAAESVEYRGIELFSDTPLTLREIRMPKFAADSSQ